MVPPKKQLFVHALPVRRQGAALVFVLAALALISFLALAILTLLRSEDRSSRTAADLTELRLLSELPEKIVISQIRRATRGLGMKYTWTSQPGMIRVFGSESTNGRRPGAEEFFKLYSAPVMTLGGGANPLSDANLFQNWSALPGMFTDLNEPVRILPTRKQGQVQDYNQPDFVFPILDVSALGRVDGFGVQEGLFDPNPTNPKLPMPVAWLYILKNGEIARSASPGGEGKTRVEGATDLNPIIGRIAFWTDDESCKLNLNTATEPAPWDEPHTRTITDEAYARAIPARGEYYRMSGHPAYTSLAPVLRHFGATSPVTTDLEVESQNLYADGSAWWQHLQDYHRLLPRTIDTKGSDQGTRGGSVTAETEAKPKQERFFASVDEFFFNTDLQNEQRTANTVVGVESKFSQEDVRRSRFFLTTHSRAPELNPFNRPKVSLWPIQKSESQRNEVDQAFADAATFGASTAIRSTYFLQRDSEWSSSGIGSSQSQDQDAALQRNKELMGYLLDLSERPLPGFGGQFVDLSDPALAKYSAESRDHLLVSMFDMIRWGVNPATPYAQKITPPLNPQYSYLPPGFGQAGTTSGIGGWSAVPMRMQDMGETIDPGDLPAGQSPLAASWAKGYGRFPTITEMSIVFAATDVETGVGGDGVLDVLPANQFSDRTKSLIAFVLFEPWMPAPGVPSVAPAYEVRMEQMQGFQLTEDTSTTVYSLGFGGSMSNIVSFSPSRAPDGLSGHPLGGGTSSYAGFGSQFLTPDGQRRDLAPTNGEVPDPSSHYLMIGQPIVFGASEGHESSTLTFSGGLAKVSIHEVGTGNVVQVLEIQFPQTTIPMPVVAVADADKVLNKALRHQMQTRFQPTASAIAGAPAQMTQLLLSGDVIRSMEVFGEEAREFPPPVGTVAASAVAGITRGDLRMLAGRVVAKQPWDRGSTVPSSVQRYFFAPHPLYYESKVNLPDGTTKPVFAAHSLRDGAVMLAPQLSNQPTIATAGRLVARLNNNNRATLEPRFDPAAGIGSVPACPPGTDGAMNLDDRPGDFDTGPGIIEDGPYIRLPEVNNGANQGASMPATNPPTKAGWFERGGEFADEDGITYMPWRQASSAFIFGSLPTGVFGRGADNMPRPWQTLLLCPNPPSRLAAPDQEPKWSATNSSERDHFGFSNPRDHLWLEFFHLPAIEPEGFGDAVSTEGKVNMNYQMVPFTWIRRATAMHGALRGVRLTAIPSSAVGTNSGEQHYKKPTGEAPSLQFRYQVDADRTLASFESLRFKAGTENDVFRSPSEICDMWLVPKRLEGHTYSQDNVNPDVPPQDYTGMLDWWEGQDKTDPTDGFEATGDNLREAPYGQLYPRLCTKSNVFTVHYRVQLLKKSRSTQPNEWDESRDTVAAEHRGQTMLERYLDPNQKGISDFATQVNEGESLDDFYQIRVVSRRDFKP